MMSEQLVSIIVMFISGIAVGAIIDCTRFLIDRFLSYTVLRHMATVIELVVWTFLGIVTFYLLFLIKGGQWRFLDPLAQIAGIFFYEALLQNVFRFIGRLVVNIFIKPIYFVGHLFVATTRKILRIILKIFKVPIIFIYKIFMKFLPNRFQKR